MTDTALCPTLRLSTREAALCLAHVIGGHAAWCPACLGFHIEPPTRQKGDT